MAKWISFQAKISLQIFLGGILQRDLSTNCQKDRPMEDHHQHREYGKRQRRLAPKAFGAPTPTMRLRVCLTVFGHQGDCISTLTKSKWRSASG